jgi:uncharacterized protein
MLARRLGSDQVRELAGRRALSAVHFGIAELVRLAGVARAGDDDPGQLDATLLFEAGPDGFPQLQLRVVGSMRLTCQRCLGPLDWPIDLEVALAIVEADQAAASLRDPFETLLMPAEGLSAAEVIEDEVLAAMPLSPAHGADSGCQPPATGITIAEPAPVEKNTPFAGLGDLLARRGDKESD